jgi:hypothetical protein
MRELPQATEKSVSFAADNENSTQAGKHDGTQAAMRDRRSARDARIETLFSASPRSTDRGEGACRAVGPGGQTDGRTQVHERLIEIPCTAGGQMGLRKPAESCSAAGGIRSRAESEDARENAPHVAIQSHLIAAKGDRGDGTGRVVADAGEFEQFALVRGEMAGVPGHDDVRRATQVPGAGVVAQAFPLPQHRSLRGAGQVAKRGEALEPGSVEGHDRLHAGLLQHDLGNPDPIWIPYTTPRHPTLAGAVPFQKAGAKGGFGIRLAARGRPRLTPTHRELQDLGRGKRDRSAGRIPAAPR